MKLRCDVTQFKQLQFLAENIFQRVQWDSEQTNLWSSSLPVTGMRREMKLI